MARQLKLRGGTTSENNTFTGVIREVTVDTDKHTVVVHDGITPGGHPMAKETHTHTPAQAGAEPANANIQAHIGATASNPHGTTAAMVSAVPTSDVVTEAVANKLLKLDANAKLPASITGDAATVGGNAPSAFAASAHGHSAATTGAAGFMSATDKAKLDGIASGATAYVHPTTDGSHHVPATGTTNNGKVLKSGATAGSEGWGVVDYSEITGKPTSLPAAGGNADTIGGLYPAAFASSTHNHDASYAPAVKGVTNGDSHDHSGGGGGQIDYNSLLNKPDISAGGGIARFTANGTFTVPAGVSTIYVTAVAGGGGGASGSTAYTALYGGGGGGGCIKHPLSVSPGQQLSITIGQGGAQGAVGASGSAGGSTSIGNLLTLTGGGGGSLNVAGVGGIGPTGAGGKSSTLVGDADGYGGGAGGGICSSNLSDVVGGQGSGIGGSGGGTKTSTNGVNGTLYGGGGSGTSIAAAATRYGGNGAPGIAIIEW